eukprot:scaffold40967_cov18-Tisochrysis_lutea.AAC.1
MLPTPKSKQAPRPSAIQQHCGLVMLPNDTLQHCLPTNRFQYDPPQFYVEPLQQAPGGHGLFCSFLVQQAPWAGQQPVERLDAVELLVKSPELCKQLRDRMKQ